MYVDHTTGRSQLTCPIHGHEHSPDECKVLVDFGNNYAKDGPTKYHSQEPATKKRFGRNQENNAVIHHAVDEIILQ